MGKRIFSNELQENAEAVACIRSHRQRASVKFLEALGKVSVIDCRGYAGVVRQKAYGATAPQQCPLKEFLLVRKGLNQPKGHNRPLARPNAPHRCHCYRHAGADAVAVVQNNAIGGMVGDHSYLSKAAKFLKIVLVAEGLVNRNEAHSDRVEEIGGDNFSAVLREMPKQRYSNYSAYAYCRDDRKAEDL
jgi:hypothetical protein